MVDDHLRLPAHPEVYVVGDVASCGGGRCTCITPWATRQIWCRWRTGTRRTTPSRPKRRQSWTTSGACSTTTVILGRVDKTGRGGPHTMPSVEPGRYG